MNYITKLFTLTICLALCAGASAQVRTVTFTGRDRTNQYHIPLHHVNVFNLDQLWEEVLVYPDTTLTMGMVGIGEHELPSGLRLMQNVPNPFDGTTEFVLIMPTDNDVTLEIYDISGKLTVSRKFGALPEGSHLFRATLMAPQTYLLGATTRDGQTTIKMVNEGHGGENSIQHIGMTDANGDFTLYLKDEKVSSNYPFHNGDEMHYIGYAKIDGNMLENDTSLRQYFYDTIPLIPFKFDVTIPTVITTTISVDLYSATCTGEVTDNGGTPVSARGVCWSTSPNPTVGDNVIPSNSGGIGDFTSNITGLIPNTTYHVRAYATNSVGTAYSADTTFTTLCNTVNVSVSGNTTINYGESTTLTATGASSYQWSTGQTTASITVSPTASTIYTVTGTNSYGCTTSASVTMTVNPIAPTVATDSVSGITDNAVFCWGNVINDGGANVTKRGFCYSNTNPVPNYVSDSHPEAGFGVGDFSKNIAGLFPNTTYYVRAYAINSVDTAYGDTVSFKTDCNVVTINISGNTNINYGSFTTLTASGASSYHWSTNANNPSITVNPTASTIYTVTGTNSYGCTATASVIVTVNYLPPTVVTNAVSNITATTATCGGHVTFNGGQPVTAQGVCWSAIHQEPDLNNSQPVPCNTGTNSFSSIITGLAPNTTYYVRAYAINSVNISYGETVSFTTLCDDVDTTVFVITCDSYIWNGVTYTASGVYTRSFTKPNGCDSTVRLNLTISHSDAVAVDTVVFENDLPFEWNGVTFMEAGTQSVTLWNIWGCDSVVVMTLIVPVIDDKSCPAAPTVTDHEGNVYATVQIGNQCWMRDNLRTTTSPSTGTYLIPPDTAGYTYTGKQARCYDNDSATYAPMNYGLLYNWNAAVDTFNTAYGETSVNTSSNNAVSVTFSGHRRGICPAGWHLPSDAEWTQLTDYVSSQSEYTCGGNNSYIAIALASAEGWNTDTNNCAVGNDPSLNNATGFSAVPAGYCLGSSFNDAFNRAYFWSATQHASGPYGAYYRHLYYYSANVHRGTNNKDYGRSVRCLRDAGTAVVDEKSCPSAPTVTDHEGNVYATVQIGNQCWMRDNLRTTTSPSTGTYLIPAANANYTYTGKQARWYDNDSATYALMNYGLLYNWNAAVDTFNTDYGELSVDQDYNHAASVNFSGHRRGICPAGWHLPSDAEWTQLTNYVSSQSEYTCSGNSSYIAKALASTEGWNTSTNSCAVGNNQGSNNATGFSAVTAGYCLGSSFSNAGYYANFWSATQDASNPRNASYRYLYYGNAAVVRHGNNKDYGRSVRCLRDAGTAVVDSKSCPAAPTVTDHEGNVYATVQIGNQCWMRDNLRTTTSPSTGTCLIPDTSVNYTYTGKQARWYRNDSATYAPKNYGLLYNWNAAVDTFNTAYEETSVNTNVSNAVLVNFTRYRRGICPAGWHLPSDAEWNTMEATVSGSDWQTNYETTTGYRGNHAGKLAGGDNWTISTTSGAPGDYGNIDRNVSGFYAVPAGGCYVSSFSGVNNSSGFWSSTQIASYSNTNSAYYRYMSCNNEGVRRYNVTTYNSRSVRCLRDAAVIDSKSCSATPTVTDHEGNVYATVQIGNQCWMRDNLRTTTSPSTGTYLIPSAGTGNTYTGKQARWYNNDSATYAPMNYGLLYNWNAAVDTFNTAYGELSVNTGSNNAVSVTFNGHRRGICPVGWHLPSDAEWTQLTNYVSSQSEYTCSGNSIYIAKALASTEGWNTSTNSCAVGNNQGSNNATGFSAVPAGFCNGSSFHHAGNSANFWSSAQTASDHAWGRTLYYSDASVYRNYGSEYYGFSVRCLRD